MTVRAAYPARDAARTPHPYILLLRKSGQFLKFCPVPGRISAAAALEIVVELRCVACRLGRTGRLGQKNTGFPRARVHWGQGVIGSCVCRSDTSALSAPRAPPCCIVARFQWVVGSSFQWRFCPAFCAFCPICPLHSPRNQHFDIQKNEITTSSYRGSPWN